MDEVKETSGIVTMQGKPVTLLGEQPALGAPAPEFKVVNGEFKPVRLADFKCRVRLISAVPSLDTSVCALQTQRFNKELAGLPASVAVLTISMDLPFAQKRFCEAEKIDRALVLSDHVWREFGTNYGLLIKDFGLLARAVFVVDAQGLIAYRQIVPELTLHPDYEAALNAVRRAV